jgi:hypothetical protein
MHFRWPGGLVQDFSGSPVNQTRFTEGQARFGKGAVAKILILLKEIQTSKRKFQAKGQLYK